MAPGLTARGLVAGLFAALVACAPAGARHAERSATASTPPARATTMTESPSGGAIGRTALVQLGDHFYSPAELTVTVGTTVIWRMIGSQEHDVWAYDGSFHSPTLGPGMIFSHTFTRPGTYWYFCVPHYGDGMYGAIIVLPANGG